MGDVLLTGATGFVGQELLDRLLAREDRTFTRSCALPTTARRPSACLSTRASAPGRPDIERPGLGSSHAASTSLPSGCRR